MNSEDRMKRRKVREGVMSPLMNDQGLTALRAASHQSENRKRQVEHMPDRPDLASVFGPG